MCAMFPPLRPYPNTLAIFTLVIISISVSRGAIYVSLTGNDADDGGINTPVRSITKAAELAQSIDIIYIRESGSYDAVLANLGKNLTITSESGTVSLEFAAGASFTVENISSSYSVKLYGIQITPTDTDSSFVFSVSTSNVVFEAVSFSIDFERSLADISLSNITFLRTVCVGQARVYYEGIRASQSNLRFIMLQYLSPVYNNFISHFAGTLQLYDSYLSSTTIISSISSDEFIARNVTVEYWETSGVFDISAESIIISDSTFRHARVGSPLIVIDRLMADVTIHNCDFHNISSSAGVGAVASIRSLRALVSNSNFTDIVSLSYSIGGALALGSTYSFVSSNRFVRCGGPLTSGGAVTVNSYNVTLSDNVFLDCQGNYGGAAFVKSRLPTIVRCVFQGNRASFDGGALRIALLKELINSRPVQEFLNITECHFRNNSVSATTTRNTIGRTTRDVLASGGAILIESESNRTLISNCIFEDNRVTSTVNWATGGAIHLAGIIQSKRFRIEGSVFRRNRVSGPDISAGGAFSAFGSFQIEISNCSFLNNAAILLPSALQSSVNDALAYGAAIYVARDPSRLYDSSLLLSYSSFDGNAALQGAVVIQNVQFDAFNCIFSNNQAKSSSSGLLVLTERFVQTIPAGLFQGELLQFSNNSVEILDRGSREVDCLSRGVFSLNWVEIVCTACSFSEPSYRSQDAFPYGGHIGVVASQDFKLNAVTRDQEAWFPCEDPIGDIFCDILVTTAYYYVSDDRSFIFGTIPNFLYFNASVQLPSCVGLLAEETLNQPGLDTATAACSIVTDEGNLDAKFILRSERLPYPGSIAFVDGAVFVGQEPDNVNPYTPLLTIKPPLNAIVDGIPQLSAPAAIDPCASDTFFSGSGSVFLGPFPRVFIWNAVVSGGSANAVVDFINAQNTSEFYLPASLWSLSSFTRKLTVSLRVSTTVGILSSPVSVTIERPSDPQPEIFLEGPTRRQSFAAIESQLNARVVIPRCLTTRTITVSRVWRVVNTDPAEISSLDTNWTGQSYFIPAGALRPGVTYTFEFSAIVTNQLSSLSKTITVVVDALFSPLSVYSIGDGGLVARNRSLTFEVALIDPDFISTPTSYLWDLKCVGSAVGQVTAVPPGYLTPFFYARSPCDPCINASVSTGPAWTIPARTVSNYTIVTIDVASRVRSTSLDIALMVDESAFLLSSETRIRFIPRWRTAKPSSTDRLVLSALIDGQMQLQSSRTVDWKVFWNSTELDLPAMLDSPVSSTNLTIVFSPGALVVGLTYRLQLSVMDSQLRRVGMNWFDLQVNNPPYGGTVNVIAASEIVQFSRVRVLAVGWQDEDVPLRYSFSLVVGEQSTTEIFVSDYVDVDAVDIDIMFAGSVNLRTSITDLYGAATIVDTPLNVLPTTNATQDSTAVLLDDLRDLISIGDLRKASSLIYLLANRSRFGSATALRSAVLDHLIAFASQKRFTSRNAEFVLKIFDLMSINPTTLLSQEPQGASLLRLYARIAATVGDSSAYGSSAFYFMTRKLGSEAQTRYESVKSALLSSASLLVDPQSDRSLKQDLVVGLIALPEAIIRGQVPGEGTFEISSDNFEGSGRVATGEDALQNGFTMIPSSNTTQSVSVKATSRVPSAELVEFVGLVFSNGSFPDAPVSTFVSNTSGLVSNQTVNVTSTAPVISISIVNRGTVPAISGASISISANTTATFQGVVPPTGLSALTSPSCMQYDSSSKSWTTSGCSTTAVASPPGTYTCVCSSLPESRPGRTSISLTMAFVDSAQPTVTKPNVAGPGSNGGTGGSEAALNIPLIAGVSVAVVVVLAVSVGAVVFTKKKAQWKLESQRIRTLSLPKTL